MSESSYVDLPSPDAVAKNCNCRARGTACWHELYIRHYAHMFNPFPPARAGQEPPMPKSEPSLPKEEKRARDAVANLEAIKRAVAGLEWRTDWLKRTAGIPQHILQGDRLSWPNGGAGRGCAKGPDLDDDSGGIWGRVVREWEDRDDARD